MSSSSGTGTGDRLRPRDVAAALLATGSVATGLALATGVTDAGPGIVTIALAADLGVAALVCALTGPRPSAGRLLRTAAGVVGAAGLLLGGGLAAWVLLLGRSPDLLTVPSTYQVCLARSTGVDAAQECAETAAGPG